MAVLSDAFDADTGEVRTIAREGRRVWLSCVVCGSAGCYACDGSGYVPSA